jgi:histidinol-phosphatase (PHP family)
MHTPLCRHASGEPLDFAARAVSLGLTEIGFSDHSPMPQDNFDDWRMRLDQLAGYVESVSAARRDFPGLTIRLALEVDYLPGQEEWIRELAAQHPWDYFIGSVHYVSDGWDIDNPQKLSRWQDRDAYEIWREYFDLLTRAAASGLFEIIGHADLPKKFGFVPERSCSPLFQSFLHTAARSGCAVELNTAGLRKVCREIYPGPAFLEQACAAAVPITFGSDAHAPEEVAMNFAEAVASARHAGYSDYCRFQNRQRIMARL